MELTGIREQGVLTIRLKGELDHHNAEQARNGIDSLLSDKGIKELILDLSGVSFMDSSGVGVILGRYRLLSGRRGVMRVTGASRSIEKILKMAGVYALLERKAI